MMGDLISRSAMIDRVRQLYDAGRVDFDYYKTAKEAAQMEPGVEDVVCVTRCKDCQFAWELSDKDNNPKMNHYQHREDAPGWYCSIWGMENYNCRCQSAATYFCADGIPRAVES